MSQSFGATSFNYTYTLSIKTPRCTSTGMMDSDSLIKLLPELLNHGPDQPAGGRPRLGGWSAGAVCSDEASGQSQSDCDQTSDSTSDEQEDGSEETEQDVQHVGEQRSPKLVDLDEIERFLDDISTSHQSSGQGRYALSRYDMNSVERLRSRVPPTSDLAGPDRTRQRALDRRLEEQNRLLDGFNAENARLYRELKQLKAYITYV
ncbi:uncharacterized protein LOC119102858 [Pollicipes pollicipes]|uniref:uncharacterized protein LOC119102858 n=1 Tax=Pollicipes pollicipes TaxID=41117 RepID=UPI0018852206|nr:uncharacterized protein LOC119102858 [Pollicipes pollicipes]